MHGVGVGGGVAVMQTLLNKLYPKMGGRRGVQQQVVYAIFLHAFCMRVLRLQFQVQCCFKSTETLRTVRDKKLLDGHLDFLY